MTSLNDFLNYSSQRVENFFDHHLPSGKLAPERLHQAIHYSAMNGGKRIRPALVYATGKALRFDLDHLDCIAAAIELMHSYSLIHDDLPAMDDDDLRRGKPTCHKAFDEATAILAGDAMQALAFEILTNMSIPGPNADVRMQLTHQLAVAVGSSGMAGGQAMDLEAASKTLTIESLEEIHRKKTGCLIQACIDMSQCCCTYLTEQQRSNLLEFAQHVGIAFQIRDDILDEISDTETLGKPQGSDKELNKPTYISLLGIKKSEALCIDFFNRAQKSLRDFDKSADLLRLLAEYIVCRKH
ncbi:MAG: farnesyl diphosphate synthase [Pseudomonadota bacterium]